MKMGILKKLNTLLLCLLFAFSLGACGGGGSSDGGGGSSDGGGTGTLSTSLVARFEPDKRLGKAG